MKLQEALQLGERAFGVIKCTYVCVYEKAKGRKLFSLQGSDTRWDDRNVWTNYAIEDHERKELYRVPVFIADRADNQDAGKYARVYFTDMAVDVIGEKYDKTTKQKKDAPGSNYVTIDNALASGGLFVVKSVAVEWYPSGLVFTRDGDYADPELRKSYDERLEAARKKMEAAKKALIAAGLSNLL